jgi:UPF0755 protein
MRKKILYIILAIVIAGAGPAIYGYSVLNTGFDIDKTVYLYIDENRDYETLRQEVKDSAKVESVSNFDMLVSLLDYKSGIKTGRYAVKPGMNIYDLVKALRSGSQSPVKVKFNNIRTKDDLARRISGQLMMSKEALLDTLDDSAKCEELGFNTETVAAMFIPDTYEYYWDVSVEDFLRRMKKEYKTFWTESRLAKAKETGLTPVEVSTLASIVEEECMYTDEYPKVAGLYINRLRIGQELQADPTVKFAVGDFSLRRVLNVHTGINSPYNTYRKKGLPPGPIRIPSIKGIDSVLNYTKHDYFYMCAKDDFSGYHNFTTNHSDHLTNRALYIKALNARGIK